MPLVFLMELEILWSKRIHRLGSYISSVHLGNNIMYSNCFYLLHRRSFRL
jgi:hypothetical protein